MKKIVIILLMIAGVATLSCEHQTPVYYTPCKNPHVSYLENDVQVCIDIDRDDADVASAYMVYNYNNATLSLNFKHTEFSQLGVVNVNFEPSSAGIGTGMEIPAINASIQNGTWVDVEGYTVLTEYEEDEFGNYVFNGTFEVTLTDQVTNESTVLSEGQFNFIGR